MKSKRRLVSIIREGSEASIVFAMLRRNKGAMVGLVFVIGLCIVAVFAPLIAPYDPLEQNIAGKLSPPSFKHLLGQDEFGRDVFSRIVYGARISLTVGISVVFGGATIGTIVGVFAGYYGGKVDLVISRVIDLFLAFPSIILAIGLMAVLGGSVVNVIASLVAVNWSGYARVVRGEALAIKEKEFVEAARSIGTSDAAIIVRHLIPNSLAPVIVLATLGVGWAILAEAGLSFIGLGVNPPTPSWGIMVSAGRSYLLSAPHLATFSGLAISFTVLAFNMVGDGLRDALDPKLRL